MNIMNIVLCGGVMLWYSLVVYVNKHGEKFVRNINHSFLITAFM